MQPRPRLVTIVTIGFFGNPARLCTLVCVYTAMELGLALSSYRNYRNEAKMLVQQLLQNALERLQMEDQRCIVWPLGKQFEPKLGQNCIEQVVEARELANCTLPCSSRVPFILLH